MNEPLTFVIMGDPVGKGRPRYGKGKVFTPAATRSYEQQVSWIAKAEMATRAPITGPVRIYMRAMFRIPASWSTEKQQRALIGIVRPTVKPDIDNIAKAICDSMNGVVYADDSQVTEIAVSKRYGHQACVAVTVSPIVGSYTEQSVSEAQSMEKVA